VDRTPTARRSEPPARPADLVAFLGGACLFLSAIEYLIPKPIPFLRVGIANLPLLIGLDLLAPASLLLVAALKVAGQGLVTGTLFSYVTLFSAGGTLASALAMLAVRRALGRRVTLVGVGVIGALVSNLCQLLLARLLVFGEGVWLVAAPFLAVGTVTAAVLGWLAEGFAARSRWLASVRGRA
jgi:heptaprenyl diphosphate synthase